MSNIEQNEQHQTVVQPKESQLPQPEVGKRAHQYIKDYLQAIRNTPEFVEEHPDIKFDRINLIEDEWGAVQTDETHGKSFPYTRGGYGYRVYFTATPNRTSLSVSKQYSKPGEYQEGTGVRFESVSLDEHVTPRGREFDRGRIEKEKAFNDGTIELHLNTPTANQEVENFLKENFDEPQPQTPAQQ